MLLLSACLVFAFTVSIFQPSRGKGKPKARVWWFAWRDGANTLHRKSSAELTKRLDGERIPIRNKRVASQYARKIEDEFARGNLGLTDPYAEHRTRPIEEHIADLKAVIYSRDGALGHKKDTINWVTNLVNGCGFKTIDDIAKEKVEVWLGEQKTREGKKISRETKNRYIWAIKHFIAYLIENGRLAKDKDPLVGLKEQKKKDKHRRYIRRALTWEQFERLLKATQESSITRRNLAPVVRAVLYLLVPQITINVSPRAVFTCLNTSFPNFMLFESWIRRQNAKCTNDSFGQDNLGNPRSRFSQ